MSNDIWVKTLVACQTLERCITHQFCRINQAYGESIVRRVIMWLPWLLLVVVTGVFLLLQQRGQQAQPINGEQQRPLVVQGGATGVVSYNAAVKVASPAVVNIYTTQKVRAHPQIDDPLLRRFFEFHGQAMPEDSPENEPTSLGSGVVVSPDGYILTNNHVVAKADKITVAFQDGSKAVAKVIGTDPDSDLAVIKVERTGLAVLPFKTSPSLVGDVVLAIGNPFGVGQTVTQGIISATGRTGLGINTYEDFIQTDAPINPGNSGGALIDVAGNLVGINTAIFSKSGGSMGIGFAIPVSLAQQVMNAIIKDGKVTRGWLGIEVGGDSEDPTALTQNTNGVLVAGVMRGGPAHKGGIKPRDRILKINNQSVGSPAQLIAIVGQIKPNTTADVLVKRGDQDVLLSVTIAERPRSNASADDEQERAEPSGDLFGQ
jgi:serine protease DegS